MLADLQVHACASGRTFSEHAVKSERLFRVDPHTGIAAKLLDEGINLYQGIAWRLGSVFRGSLPKRVGAMAGSTLNPHQPLGNDCEHASRSVAQVWRGTSALYGGFSEKDRELNQLLEWEAKAK